MSDVLPGSFWLAIEGVVTANFKDKEKIQRCLHSDCGATVLVVAQLLPD
jgi:hypothetical protein